jgi:AcrR family transcriptional regulator
MSAPRTARERVREEMTGEILGVARRHVAEHGAAALSLRSVARDLEMAPSALYRYFDGRDALLSALILDGYQSLAAEAERAAAGAAATPGDAERWLVVPRAVRSWALAHPHEWGLLFGSPVPGYHAPEATVVPYARIGGALVRPVVDAQAAGRLAPILGVGATTSATAPSAPAPPDGLAAAVAPVTEGLFPDQPAGTMPVATVVRSVHAFTTLVGIISLEVFGHWRKTILDPAAFFDATMREAGALIGLV